MYFTALSAKLAGCLAVGQRQAFAFRNPYDTIAGEGHLMSIQTKHHIRRAPTAIQHDILCQVVAAHTIRHRGRHLRLCRIFRIGIPRLKIQLLFFRMIANSGVYTTTDTVRCMPLCAKPHHTVLLIQLVCERIIREDVVEIFSAVCVSNRDGCLGGIQILYRNAKACIGIQLPKGERFPCVKQNIFRLILLAALILNYLCSAAEGKRAILIVHAYGVLGNRTAFQRTFPAIEQYADVIAADYAAVQVERATCHRNAGGTTADVAFLAVHQSEGAVGAYGNCRSTVRCCDALSVQTKHNIPIRSFPCCA